MDSMQEDNELLRDLYGLLAEWKKLTLAEGEHIRSGDWNALESLQSKKVVLQQSIETQEKAFSENRLISDELKNQERTRLKQMAAELLHLEKTNEALLSDRIAEADRQLKSSSKTIQSLRHVQKAYGTGRHSFWQAYS